ncbi:MAG: hypothetical protein ABH879_04175 [archaeon]
MDERGAILTENVEEYYSEANKALKNQKWNTATTLYFKAMAALCDLFLLKKEGSIPRSYTHRFRILEKYKEVYNIIDKDFPFYQDSYTHRMDKETAELLKEDVDRIKEIANY